MKQSLSSTAANYQDYIKSRGIEGKVVELPDSTRTAAEAAFAIGCEIAEIAKSVVFYVKDTHRPVLVIACGINRVDEKKLKKIMPACFHLCKCHARGNPPQSMRLRQKKPNYFVYL